MRSRRDQENTYKLALPINRMNTQELALQIIEQQTLAFDACLFPFDAKNNKAVAFENVGGEFLGRWPLAGRIFWSAPSTPAAAVIKYLRADKLLHLTGPKSSHLKNCDLSTYIIFLLGGPICKTQNSACHMVNVP